MEKGLVFAVATELAAPAPVVQGDPLLLYSMLHNLVKNAAEAVAAGETVNVGLSTGHDCCISIHNPGCVPAEIADRFFEKYATYGKSGGTGLGTYSALLIAKAHGGSIAMHSTPTDGTRIDIRLPQMKSN
jgi:signal transduction histidine kinase